MLDRQMETTNLPKCRDENVAFFAYSPSKPRAIDR